MAAPKTSYASLPQITDPALRQIVKLIYDKIAAVEQATTQIGHVTQPLSTHLDFNQQRGIGVADPTADTDVVNLQTLKRYVEAATAAAPAKPPKPGP